MIVLHRFKERKYKAIDIYTFHIIFNMDKDIYGMDIIFYLLFFIFLIIFF